MVADPRLPKRFRVKLKVTERGCWEWTAGRRHGYGQFSVGSRTTKTVTKVSSHRLAYELLVGPIPEGLVLDHLCRNPPCCNPDHLEPVTQQVNTLRGTGLQAENVLKTHCPQGHAYDDVNTYVWHRTRTCRACNRAKASRYRARKAASSW